MNEHNKKRTKSTKIPEENLQKKMFHNSRHPSERSPVVSLLDIARIFFFAHFDSTLCCLL